MLIPNLAGLKQLKVPDDSIALIIPFFGEFPWFFSFFLKTCSYNASIHFFIITNNNVDHYHLPGNVFVIHRNFDELKKDISTRLGLEISLEKPYKLCDYKPAYGIIFSELVKGYAFWGHCDIDIIFGNIKSFITDKILQAYDVISIRHQFVTGFFALYKNTPVINQLFKQSKDYKKIFTSEKYWGFDECSLLCTPLTEGKKLSELKADIESITHIVKKLAKEKKIKAYFNFHVVESTPGNLKWIKGKLIYKDAYEVLLYHLVSFKIHEQLKIPKWKQVPDAFAINTSSISKLKSYI